MNLHGEGDLGELVLSLSEHLLSLLFGEEIHFVDEDKDFGFGGVLFESVHSFLEVLDVLLEFVTLHIENENEDGDVSEEIISLFFEVALHEGLLTSTIPKEKRKVTQETNICGVDFEGGFHVFGFSGEVVGENDGPHGGFPTPASPHQEDFRLGDFRHDAFFCFLLLGGRVKEKGD